MKTSRALSLAAATLAIGFFAARWCAAQPTNQASGKMPASYDFGALQQFNSLVSYLQDTKQTNILQRFKDYSNASMACQQYSDIAVNLTVLKSLREGRTNQAYKLLEGNLDADIVGFSTTYRQLPASLRNQTSLKVLKMARNYRARYSSDLDPKPVEDAFKILDNK